MADSRNKILIYTGDSLELKVSRMQVIDNNGDTFPITVKLEPHSNGTKFDHFIFIENKPIEFPI